MDLNYLSSVVKKSAPLLASVITPINPLAGLVINSIATLFGSHPENLADIAHKINNDPDAAIKLKALQMQHEEILSKNHLDDVGNARSREETMVKILGRRDWLLDSLAFAVVVGYFVMCTFMVFNKQSAENNQVLFMMFGQLTGGFIMVLSYYFGSSKKNS
jgi:hypothetical protein